MYLECLFLIIVFVEHPPSVVLAPAGVQVLLKCSVITGYSIVDWNIMSYNSRLSVNIRNSLMVETLRNQGFELRTSPSTSTSFLAVNGAIEEANLSTVICVAEEEENIHMRRPRSAPTRLIFHGNCNHC